MPRRSLTDVPDAPGAADGGDVHVRAAMDALRRIVRALRLAATDVERDVGISVAQLFVLQHLAGGRALSINELAAATVTDPSTVSGVVKRLDERGLVRRKASAGDARRAEVSLSHEGIALLERTPPAPQTRLIAALEALPRRRRTALAADLEAVAEAMGSQEPTLFFEERSEKRSSRRVIKRDTGR